MMRSLRALPKAHLHLHLTASMRPATLAELYGRAGVAVIRPRSRWSTFGEFAAAYSVARSAMSTPGDVRRVVVETIEDAASDGVIWLELQTALSSRGILGGPEAALELMLAAVHETADRVGLQCGLIVSVHRGTDPDEAVRAARLAVRHKAQGVVGFGLGGDESHAAEPLAAAFHLAAEAGLLSVPHAGEFASADSVWRALDALGADRIQHGIRAVDDVELLWRLAEERVCLDVCPSSNVALGAAPSLPEHPIPDLLAAGVPCSVNADGPLFFGSSLLNEYEHCRDEMGLDDRELARMASSSIEASAAPEVLKRAALSAVRAWLDDGAPTL